jgi:hypothetical protein
VRLQPHCVVVEWCDKCCKICNPANMTPLEQICLIKAIAQQTAGSVRMCLDVLFLCLLLWLQR